MNDESFSRLEQYLTDAQSIGAPVELRGTVLGQVQRHLRARRRERRAMVMTLALLALGVVLNLSSGWNDSAAVRPLASRPTQETLINVGVAVAEATDAETGHRFVQHLAALGGAELSREQDKAIQREIHKRLPPGRKAG